VEELESPSRSSASNHRNEPTPRELLPSLPELFRRSNTAFAVWLTVLCVGVLTAALWRASRYLHDRDDRHRAVLTAAVVAWVVANTAVGLAGVRRRTSEDQTLVALREDLVELKNVERWAFLAEGGVPLPVEYVAESVWPTTRPTHLASWGELSQFLARLPGDRRRLLVVEWNERSSSRLRISGVHLHDVGPTRFLWNTRLRVFFVAVR
jgi:hypothetical protein